MIDIRSHVSLKPYHTFHVEASASYFVELSSRLDFPEIHSFIRRTQLPVLILGGGSNLLFTRDFPGLVIHVKIPGIELESVHADDVRIKVGAGVRWHDLVMYCVAHEYYGIENLASIPGTVGAAPVQNIGAYGVELKDVFITLEAIDLKTGQTVILDRDQCCFGYRKSIFKTTAESAYLITSVVLQLSKHPSFKTEYEPIKLMLAEMDIRQLTIQTMADAIIRIRQSKLPDPARIGNAGSFFKNPELSQIHFADLKAACPDLPGFPTAEGGMKVPAAWLIEKTGWKGRRIGDVGIHENHALILVNYGAATGEEIRAFAQRVRQAVWDCFEVELEPEVNLR